MRVVRAVVVGVAVSVALIVVLVWGFGALTNSDREQAASSRLGTGLSGLSVTTSTKIRFSPDGARVLVVAAGQVAVVGIEDDDVLVRAGRNVVDAAWMPDGERVLVIEGPIPTGQILTLDMNGEVDGVARLSAPIGFGDGNGLAVDSRGTKAAVIATTRDALGGRVQRDLATVELQTGEVRVYATPDRDESDPLFVDDDFVAVASETERGAARLDVVDLNTAERSARRPITGGPFARTIGGEVVVARGASQGATRLVAVDAQTGDERELHVTKTHRRVVAVDRDVTRCLVRVAEPGGTARLALESFA